MSAPRTPAQQLNPCVTCRRCAEASPHARLLLYRLSRPVRVSGSSRSANTTRSRGVAVIGGFTVLVPSPLRARRLRAWLGSPLVILGVVFCDLTAQAASAAVPNPAWSGSCPQRFLLVLDQSESMGAQEDEVQQAAEDLVDALRGTTNLVGVITFGTDARRDVDMTDVSDDERRQRIKDHIDDLDILTGAAGGTNWEAALASAESLDPDVVVLVTDGQPSVHGVPADMTSQPEDALNVTASVAAADRLKQAGTRVVGVGLGLDQTAVAEANLVAVTGPGLGDDYYTAGVHDLLPALYDVVSKSCAIPVDALPAPQRRGPDLLPLAAAAAAVLAPILITGFVLARRRAGEEPRPGRTAPRRTVLADPSISMDDIPVAAPTTQMAETGARGEDRLEVGRSSAPAEADAPAAPRPPARRIKLPPPPPREPPRNAEHD